MTLTEPASVILSKPFKVDITVYRGDSGSFQINVKDDDDNPIDISGASWDADIRVKDKDPTIVTSFDIEPVVGSPSSILINLTAEHSALLTRNCVYDVQMTLDGVVTTLIAGELIVTLDVSRSL